MNRKCRRRPGFHPALLGFTVACALGPEAGEWLQQATPTIRARVPLEVLRDTIQPFPLFSEIFVDALHALNGAVRRPGGAR